mmetsp:Transcript_46741/g.138071  ORF Transcript_46741/g.138071 Transcript_46741/m.138071 type:complete len:629 (+) Transcript_46741:98-1984(+)
MVHPAEVLHLILAFSLLARTLQAWSPSSAIAGVTFTDTNPARAQLLGVVQWVEPSDTSGIDHYEVHVASDDQDSCSGRLWDNNLAVDSFPVGTTQIELYDPTRLLYTCPNIPSLFIVVRAYGSSDQSDPQPVNLAGVLRFYDMSDQRPDPIAMVVAFSGDTDETVDHVTGTLQWTPAAGSNLAVVTEYAVYTAEDAAGTGEQLVQTVPVGTNSLDVGPSLDVGSRRQFLVYAQNPNGKADTAAAREFYDVNPAAPMTTTGTTTTTSTVTTTETAASSTVVWGVRYTDTNPAANKLGGIIRWNPPLDVTGLVNYKVFIAYDSLGTCKAELWNDDPAITKIPIGTNQLTIYGGNTNRGRSGSTGCADSPMNWIVVFGTDADGSALESTRASVPLLDLSESAPAAIPLASLSFSDGSAHEQWVEGTVTWEPEANTDLALASAFSVYLADDAAGARSALVASVPMGTNALVIDPAIWVGSRTFVLVYARNPIGRASSVSGSVQFADDASLPPIVTVTSTTSTATSTSTELVSKGAASAATAAVATQCLSHQVLNRFKDECEECPDGMVVTEDQAGCVEKTILGMTEMELTAVSVATGSAGALGSAALFAYQRWKAQRAASGAATVAGGGVRV